MDDAPPPVVVDTNVWVSAFINAAGAPARVVDAFLADRFVPVTSLALSDEIHEVLHRPRIYRELGVEEYMLFDPLEEYVRPSLQLLRLVDGEYVPVAPNAAGRYPSATLGLELGRRGHLLGLYDPRTGQWLRDLREAEAARREAEAEAEVARRAEVAARREAEAEIARLRAELARLRLDQPR